jgi:pescadillo protein
LSLENQLTRLNRYDQVWAIRTNALRRVFLSIKGIYYECEVPSGQSGTTVPVRWLEPYEFTQHVPSDVDFRILLTFLDLYRTLTSFVLYKLYTDENLVYPPPMDVQLDQRGEGVGKFKLVEREEEKDGEAEQARTADGKRITKKDVKKSIKSIQKAGTSGETEEDQEMEDVAETNDEPEEEFVHHPSKNDEDQSAPLPTYTSLLATSSDPSSSSAPFQIFSPYTFYLSRETSSRTWEFIIRAFGGKVVTDLAPTTDREDPLSLSSSSGDKITHVIIDRPMGKNKMKELSGERKWVWVQPQWVADCANRREILPSGEGSGYEPGGALPPHLSPWDGEGEVERPWFKLDEKETGDVEMGEEKEAAVQVEEDDEEEDDEEKSTKPAQLPPALLAASQDPTDPTLMHQAELEAESLGQSAEQFKTQLALAIKSNPTVSANKEASKKQAAKDEDMRKIMMTGKKQRLYTKMKYSNDEKRAEVSLFIRADECRRYMFTDRYSYLLPNLQQAKLEEKRMSIEKRKKKEQKAKLAAKAAA